MTAYINTLNRMVEVERTYAHRKAPTLRERLIDWYARLPQISRDRPFSMSELETALCSQGRFLSPILLSLGWQRRRNWTGTGQYMRFWIPPRVQVAPAD